MSNNILGYQALKGNELVLKYKVKTPSSNTNEKAPVVILLHGVGSNEDDLFSLANQFPSNYLIISARAPFTMGSGSYAWYQVDFSTGKPIINAEQAEKSRLIIKQFIGQIVEKYHADDKNVTLMGFSQGAIMSYSVGLSIPQKVKSIVSLSGRILNEIRPEVKQSPALKKLRVFIAHAINDDVLKYEYAMEAKSYLKSIGIQAQTFDFNEGHTVTPAEVAAIIKWLSN